MVIPFKTSVIGRRIFSLTNSTHEEIEIHWQPDHPGDQAS